MVEEENIVLIEILTEFIHESMRVFWEFLRADKDEASRSTHVHLQDPSDSELLIDIKTSLQKVCFYFFFFTILIGTVPLFGFIVSHLKLWCRAEGEKVKGHSEKWELHCKEVPKASRRKNGPGIAIRSS